MDSLITAAARALAAGDPLGALNRVALRDDAPALALRGIAMAQLGDLGRAKTLLRRAARAFSPQEAVAARALRRRRGRDRARLARPRTGRRKRSTRRATRSNRTATALNAAHARYLETRRLLLIGRLDEAERLARRASIRRRCRRHRGRPMSWLLPASRCGACGSRRRAQR